MCLEPSVNTVHVSYTYPSSPIYETWGLQLREKGRRNHSLPITWAQIWNRAAMTAADARRAGRGERTSGGKVGGWHCFQTSDEMTSYRMRGINQG